MTQTNWLALDGSDITVTISLRADHYGFAASMNAMPLAQSEYELACRHYPIVFIAANEEATQFQSVVLLGLNTAKNLFVQDDQTWAPYCYIPAYAKCYPFQLGLDEKLQRPVVTVDAAYPGLNDKQGQAFFTAQGQPNEFLEQLSHALRTLQLELEHTQQWILRLKQQGLLIQRTITLTTAENKTEQIAGIWVVDTEKLSDLDDTVLANYFHNGTLALIEQHRLSLANLDQLALRAS